MIARILYIIVGFIELVIGLRFVFLLIGANPSSQFVNWIYGWSNTFVAPFAGIFGQHATVTAAGQGVVAQSIFDWTALIALVVYGLIGGFVARMTVHHTPHSY
ncbi:MAG TPA: hypothetical protein VIH90_07455 [Candidatus Saccharimonadales bacterium]